MLFKNVVLAAQFVKFSCYISIWLQNNCNKNNYFAYIYLISYTKPYHGFVFVSINLQPYVTNHYIQRGRMESCRIKHDVMHIPEWLYCLN